MALDESNDLLLLALTDPSSGDLYLSALHLNSFELTHYKLASDFVVGSLRWNSHYQVFFGLAVDNRKHLAFFKVSGSDLKQLQVLHESTPQDGFLHTRGSMAALHDDEYWTILLAQDPSLPAKLISFHVINGHETSSLVWQSSNQPACVWWQ